MFDFTLSRPSFIWRNSDWPEANTRTYFKNIFRWQPGQATSIKFAADPTASLWINGTLVIDRTLRFVSPYIPVETLDVASVLEPGANVVVILHHWWGVSTFQRTAGGHPGIAFAWGQRWIDAGWFWCDAKEYEAHPFQTIGHDGAARIRFPVLIDMMCAGDDLHAMSMDPESWCPAQPVVAPAWSDPVCKETPPLKSELVLPKRVVSYGKLEFLPEYSKLPVHEVGKRIKATRHLPQVNTVSGWFIAKLTQEMGALAEQQSDRLQLEAGEGYVCLDFGEPVHGYLVIDVEYAPAGAVLEFGYCELMISPADGRRILNADGSFDPEFTVGTPAGDRIVLRDGQQQVLIHDERTWRWLLLQWSNAPKEIRLKSIHCRSSQHPVVEHGSFQIHREALSKSLESLVRQCLVHARITMSDTYVDTTGREDAQWLEDTQYRARLAATWFGDESLRQVTIRHAVEQQDPHSGLFRVFAPEDYGEHGSQFLDWGMAWVGMLHDDWQWTGSTERICRYFPALELFLKGLEQWIGTDGLLTGENCLCDLRTSDRACYGAGGVESIPNACYYGTLLSAAAMAGAVGVIDRAQQWERKAQNIKKHFSRFLTRMNACGSPTVAETWNPKWGAGGFGQAAVVSAAFYGLLDAPVQRAALATAFTAPLGLPPAGMKAWNTPTYIYRLLRVLCESGLGILARDHLFHVYAPYLPDGPLPEYFQMGNGQPVDPTGSHGWASVPLAWMHDTVLGVSYRHATGTNPGAIVVRPLYAGWKQVHGEVVTPAGIVKVRVDWETMNICATTSANVLIETEFLEENICSFVKLK